MIIIIDGIKYEALMLKGIYGWHLIANNENKDEYIRIPDNIEGLPIISIAESAFAGNTNIKNIEIPDSIEIIHKYAFRNCENLETVTVYKSSQTSTREIFSLYAGVFENCNKLNSFICDKPCHLNGINVFKNCLELSNIGINNKIFGNVYAHCFCNCTKLTNLHFVSKNCRLWTNCFYGCSNLKQLQFDCDWITLPKSIFKFLSTKQIMCKSNSILAEMAYTGANIEIIEEKII